MAASGSRLRATRTGDTLQEAVSFPRIATRSRSDSALVRTLYRSRNEAEASLVMCRRDQGASVGPLCLEGDTFTPS